MEKKNIKTPSFHQTHNENQQQPINFIQSNMHFSILADENNLKRTA